MIESPLFVVEQRVRSIMGRNTLRPQNLVVASVAIPKPHFHVDLDSCSFLAMSGAVSEELVMVRSAELLGRELARG